MRPFLMILAASALSLPSAGLAETMFHVRPGQTVAAHLDIWQQPCTDFVLTTEPGVENYLTCQLGPNQAATANISPDGVAWWARFWGAEELERPEFMARAAEALALVGAPEACDYYGNAAECWTVGTLQVMIPLERSGGQWAAIMEDPTLYQQE
jgi:hypothetical protein